jgi:fructose/tagatose bisphosphate aldolase
MTALLAQYVRQIEPQGITVSIGGEIGHIGGKNSTVEEFEAFIQGFRKRFSGIGLSKVSVQTGTSHGGMLLPDGTMAKVNLDFDVLRNIGKVARETYGIGGPVQHGASTLPLDLFDQFPASGTIEVHLATGFQNTLFDALPEALRTEMHGWVMENCAKERKEGWTDEQFIYKLRKRPTVRSRKSLPGLTRSQRERYLMP